MKNLEAISLDTLSSVTGGLITQCGMRLDTKKWGCITYGYDAAGRYFDSSEGGYAATPPPPGKPAGWHPSKR
jgi:hypothetical protein